MRICLIVVGTSVRCYGRVVAQRRNQPLKDVTMCLGVGYCAVAPWWGLRWSSHANPSWLHVGPVEIRAIQSVVDTRSTSRRENNVQCLHHFTATSSFFCQKLQPLLTVLKWMKAKWIRNVRKCRDMTWYLWECIKIQGDAWKFHT